MCPLNNQRLKVKICGLTSLEDSRFVSGALADYLGFIFYEKSPRFISPDKAGAIVNWIHGPECVGVFVNQPLDDVNRTARHSGVDLVQLHGSESPEYCQLIEKPVIKAIHIEENTKRGDILSTVKLYRPVVDYLLFDNKIKGKWGGTGETFNWSLIKDVAGDTPYFLSGGLNPENVASACREVHPYAIDLSSGLEREPGIKDFDLIEALMDEMREIWAGEDSINL